MIHRVIFLVGIAMVAIGLLVIISSLDQPLLFAFQIMILGAVFSGLGVVVIAISVVFGRNNPSLFVCSICDFAVSSQADLYNHMKTHPAEAISTSTNDKLKTRKKVEFKKSPVLQGTVIGIIICSILFAVFFSLTNNAFSMSNDAMSPTINKGDLIHYKEAVTDDIHVGDIIVFHHPQELDKIMVHKVVAIRDTDPKILETKSEQQIAMISTPLLVSENLLIGKVDSISKNYLNWVQGWMILIIIIAAFIAPIMILKIIHKQKIQ